MSFGPNSIGSLPPAVELDEVFDYATGFRAVSAPPAGFQYVESSPLFPGMFGEETPEGMDELEDEDRIVGTTTLIPPDPFSLEVDTADTGLSPLRITHQEPQEEEATVMHHPQPTPTVTPHHPMPMQAQPAQMMTMAPPPGMLSGYAQVVLPDGSIGFMPMEQLQMSMIQQPGMMTQYNVPAPQGIAPHLHVQVQPQGIQPPPRHIGGTSHMSRTPPGRAFQPRGTGQGPSPPGRSMLPRGPSPRGGSGSLSPIHRSSAPFPVPTRAHESTRSSMSGGSTPLEVKHSIEKGQLSDFASMSPDERLSLIRQCSTEISHLVASEPGLAFLKLTLNQAGDSRDSLLDLLAPHVTGFLTAPQSMHVTEGLFDAMQPLFVDFCRSNFVELAKDKAGCVSLQYVLKHFTDLVPECVELHGASLHVLANHTYGNYVIQCLIDIAEQSRWDDTIAEIAAIVLPHLSGLYGSKFGSHLLEKLIKVRAPGVVDALVAANLQAICTDAFGNYVVQTALKITSRTDQTQHAKLVAQLNPLRAALAPSPGGSRIINLLDGVGHSQGGHHSHRERGTGSERRRRRGRR